MISRAGDRYIARYFDLFSFGLARRYCPDIAMDEIPVAINMDRTLTMDRDRNLRLTPEDELREMLLELGITPDMEVISGTSCHRAPDR